MAVRGTPIPAHLMFSVLRRHAQGRPIRAIARDLGIDRNTARKYIRAGRGAALPLRRAAA